ncbi:MAG: DUF2283 domain-containing protein [Dehalococcoidia bacterium]
MKIRYDSEANILRILFKETPIADSDEDPPGVIHDYDADGKLVGLEILGARQA